MDTETIRVYKLGDTVVVDDEGNEYIIPECVSDELVNANLTLVLENDEMEEYLIDATEYAQGVIRAISGLMEDGSH
jgi:hypothetical protein